MINNQQLAEDIEFLLSTPEEFMVAGRFSVTCMLRTLVALHEEATCREMVEALVPHGYNATTVRIQFKRSRAISAAMQ